MDLLQRLTNWSFENDLKLTLAIEAATLYFPEATFIRNGVLVLHYVPTGSLQYDLWVAKFLLANGGTMI